MKNKTIKIIIIFIAIVIIIATLYLFFYYTKHASIKNNIASYAVNYQCNLLDEKCSQTYHDNYKNNPVRLSDDQISLDVYVAINTCHNIKIESAKKNNSEQMIIILKEAGLSCLGGSDLQKISILFNESINLSKLEVVQKNKSYNNPLTDFFKFSEKETIYP